MREILYRGKRVDNGEWVYGDLLQFCRYCFIVPLDCNPAILPNWNVFEKCVFKVVPETVGQYTGLTYKTGTKIFEGDILSFEGSTNLWSTCCGVVEYRRGMFVNAYNYKGDKKSDERFDYLENVSNEYEVIGNTYDNPKMLPELLEVEE